MGHKWNERGALAALLLAACTASPTVVHAQPEPKFGMEFEFAGNGNRIVRFEEMPFENYKKIMEAIVRHYGGRVADIKRVDFTKPTTNLDRFPTGERPLFRAEWKDPRGRTWLIEPEYVASTGFDGYELVTPPMNDTRELQEVLEKVQATGLVREGRRSGVHLTIDANRLIKPNGDARALANLIMLHENYEPLLRRIFNPVRGGGHENYFARSLSQDHIDLIEEIDRLPANRRSKAKLEQLFAAREGREAMLHEADPMDPNSWNKLWKYRAMNLAKALNINANHNGNAGLVEFRMFDLADPETHRLQAELYRNMVRTAERLANEGTTVKLDRVPAPAGADPAVHSTPDNLPEARAKANAMLETLGVNPNDYTTLLERSLRVPEVRSTHEFRGMLDGLPTGRITHNGQPFTYGFELEGRGAGLTKIAIPTDATVARRWGRMSDAQKRAYYEQKVGDNHSSVKTHFKLDTQKHKWLDPYWYVEGTGNWEIHSRVMENLKEATDAMRTAKELTGNSGKGFHLHMRDNAPDWEKLEARGSQFADFMERAATWVYLKRVERLRTDLSLKSWSNARFSAEEVENIARIEETDRATMRIAEVERGGYGDGEFIDIEIRGLTKYVDDVETLAKIIANNMKTAEFGSWGHLDNVMPSEAWGSTPKGLEFTEHMERYLRDVEGRALTPEKRAILEGLQDSWSERAGGDNRAYSTGVATPLLPWGEEAALDEVERRKARFAQEEYLGWLNRYTDRIQSGEFGLDLSLANETALQEKLGLTPEEARAVIAYRRASGGGDLNAAEALRAVALRNAGNQGDMEKIARIDALDLNSADKETLRNRLGLTAAQANKLLTYRQGHDVESSLAKTGLTAAAKRKVMAAAQPLDIGNPDVTANEIRARTGLDAETVRAIIDYRSANDVSTEAGLKKAGLDADEVREVMELVSQPLDLSNKTAAEIAEALGITEAKAKQLVDARTPNRLRRFNDVVDKIGLSEAAQRKLRSNLRTLERLNNATYEELLLTGITENQAKKLVNYRDANNINSERVLENILGRSAGRGAYAKVAGFDLKTATQDRMERVGVDYDVAEKIANYRDPHRIGHGGAEFGSYNAERAAEQLYEADILGYSDQEKIEERTRGLELKDAQLNELTERLGMTAAQAKKFLAHRDAHRMDRDALKSAGFTAAEATKIANMADALNPAETSVNKIMERTGLSRAKAQKLKTIAAVDFSTADANTLREAGINQSNAERLIAFREAVGNAGEEIDYKEVVRKLRLRVRKWVRDSGLSDAMLRSLLPRTAEEISVARGVNGQGEAFSGVRRGAAGAFVPSKISYETVGDIFSSVRNGGLTRNGQRLSEATTDAERTNLETGRANIDGLRLEIVETNDILADRNGNKVRVSTGMLNEIHKRIEALEPAQRGFMRHRVIGLILAHETAHAGGIRSEKLADAEAIKILEAAEGLGRILGRNVRVTETEVRQAVETFTSPTGATHVDNFFSRLRNLFRYGPAGRRIHDLTRAAQGEEIDRFAQYRRADGTLDWKKLGKSTALREGLGTAHFALGLFLKELAVVARTGDRVRIEEFFDGLATTDFYTHYGMFVIGARAGEVAYVRYLERYIKPRFVNGILKTNLVLAAGLALPEIVNGTFTGRAFVISLTSLGLSSAAVRTGMRSLKWVYDLKKAKDVSAIARTGMAAGKLARLGGWFYTAVELAVILYFAEDMDHAINGWLDRREARKALAAATNEFTAAVGDPGATAESVEEAGRAYHDAWNKYREFLYTPMHLEEAMFAHRLEGVAREAKLMADRRKATLDRLERYPNLKRNILSRHPSIEAYADSLASKDDEKLTAEVEKYAKSYQMNRDRLLEELYEDNKRGDDLLGDVDHLDWVLLGGRAGAPGDPAAPGFFGDLSRKSARGDLEDAIEDASLNRGETFTDEARVFAATMDALRNAGYDDRAAALGETHAIIGLLREADERLRNGDGMVHGVAGTNINDALNDATDESASDDAGE